jgi:arsenite-transporting ATPase
LPFNFRRTAPQFEFFAGKGGVGKTTCAVRYALAGVGKSRRSGGGTLIVSTDPAHSLGDVLGVRLGSTPKAVRAGVRAVELDAPRAFARWMAAHRRALADIVERGTWLDRSDVAALLDLTIPGVDELAGLIEISALARGSYDRVVIDTAPTGHTLRLLGAPAAVTIVAGVLDALQEDHRIIREQLARVVREDAADRLIELLASQAADVAALLRDPERTAFHWITLPEPLSIAESEDGLAALGRADIRVAEVVVNRVWPKGPKCAVCDPRRTSERRVVSEIRRRFGRYGVRLIPDHTKDTKGTKDTKASQTYSGGSEAGKFAIGSAQLVFVGGKGGVGKTTVAAALALRVAHTDRARSVLLLSTDPAHSLGDVFEASVDNDERAIRGGPANLFVRELDAASALAARRGDLEAAFDDVGDSIGPGAATARRLMDLAPPGVDELFGMLSIVEARSRHGVIIVDTAPTGHALRLLEMPDAARQWVQTLLRVLLKYKAMVRPGKLAAELVEASQSIRTLQGVLRDARATQFLVVTRAEAPARAETERLLRRLRLLKLATPAIVVNARTLTPRCRWCRAAARAEARETRELATAVRKLRLRDCAIIQTPAVAPPPRGAAALAAWASSWSA